jgi:hypothetical protein
MATAELYFFNALDSLDRPAETAHSGGGRRNPGGPRSASREEAEKKFLVSSQPDVTVQTG